MEVAPAEGQGVPGQPACPHPWVGRGRLRGSSGMRQQARGALWPCTSLLQTAEPHGSQAASPKAAPSLPPQFSVSKRSDGQMLRAPRGHSLPCRLLSHHNPGLKTCSQQLWARICSGLYPGTGLDPVGGCSQLAGRSCAGTVGLSRAMLSPGGLQEGGRSPGPARWPRAEGQGARGTACCRSWA